MSTRQDAQLAVTDETRQEGSIAMTIQTNIRDLIGSIEKMKALAAGLLAAAMMAAGMLASAPAHAATTFTVNDIRDSPDASTATSSTCDIDVFSVGDQCTLRAAIQQANATSGADTINFNIAGSGVKTISVNSGGFGALPAITEQVSINGYTQPGASPNTLAVGDDAALKIQLDGTNVGNSGLEIATADGSVIKGLVINRFGTGIAVGGDSVANRIEGNFMGTDPTGTLDRGNRFDAVAIFDGASENIIGGTTPAARNVISGNACNAVFVGNATGNRIEGNYIGTDKTGTKGLPNGDEFVCAAVAISSSSGNTVGGTTAGVRNLISGNAFDGVGIVASSQSNKVLGNSIGTTANGTGNLGNGEAGVVIQGPNNSVGNGTAGGSNTIAFNGKDGVEVSISAAIGNAISRNSIFSNVGLGIDLLGGVEDAAGNTANDPGDVDPGPNRLQNKPVITSAKTVSGKTTIKGTLNSGGEVSYLIQFFSNPSGSEGKKFIGQKNVTADFLGNASFTFSPATKVAAGQTITATATNLRGGDTSEFSAPKKVATS